MSTDWRATSSLDPSDGDFVPADGGGWGEGTDGQDHTAHNEAQAYDGCRICKSMDHKARDCPDKPADFGKCFGCGEEGHTRKECPNAPPATCKLCRQEGHELSECNANRLFQAYGTQTELSDEDAWAALQKADAGRDLDDIKAATFAYAKAAPGVTIESLEEAFRSDSMNTFLIAKEHTISVTHTLVNFQGQPDQKYVTTFQFSDKPRRKRQDEGWPSSPEENMERLKDAGFVVDSMVTVCRNCGETGHTSKSCEQDKVEVQRIEIVCSSCDEHGHRARDCTAPRRKPGKPRECRVCGSTEHLASDCTEKPTRACRNCDSTEHEAKECDQPKDWSRVTCNNCGEKGHGSKRCKQPPADADGYDHDNHADEAAVTGDGGW